MKQLNGFDFTKRLHKAAQLVATVLICSFLLLSIGFPQSGGNDGVGAGDGGQCLEDLQCGDEHVCLNNACVPGMYNGCSHDDECGPRGICVEQLGLCLFEIDAGMDLE